MANAEHVDIVKRGAAAIAEWHGRNFDDRLELGNAELGGLMLSHADLRTADLTGANLADAKLSLVDFSTADLTNANLAGAHLSGVNFTAADLDGVNFTGTKLLGTIFAKTDLSSVRGLRKVTHLAPSSISVDMLYESAETIPEEFLRGCGVPDGLIEYLPSLLGMQEAIQFYSCFISYSHQDEEFCQRLHSRMRDEHLRVWFAPEDMKAGRKIHEQIDQAIRLHDKLLIVLSEASIRSDWVETEIYRARQREKKEGKQVLFPIGLAPFEKIKEWKAFDADTGKDMAREAREYFIPDFSNWKDHDAFEKAFKRLLDDLKESE